MDLTLPSTSVRATDNTTILDDDLVGHVTRGGDFCLDLTTGGMLEVWQGPLTANRIAVALFNRSPGDDSITISWAALNLQNSYAVRDVWAAQDLGRYGADFSLPVAAHSTRLLVLTPA